MSFTLVHSILSHPGRYPGRSDYSLFSVRKALLCLQGRTLRSEPTHNLPYHKGLYNFLHIDASTLRACIPQRDAQHGRKALAGNLTGEADDWFHLDTW